MADKPSVGVDALSDLWWFIGIMVVLGALWIAGGGAERYGDTPPPQAVKSPLSNRVTYSVNQNQNNGSSRSVSLSNYRSVRISRGTAASTYQPGQEYIILNASANQAPVAITGWTLTNGKGQKLIIRNSRFAEQPSTQAVIPTGTNLFDPNGKHLAGPIVLQPGDRAYVITGSGKSFGDYPIETSFKVNKCLGYVEEENGYDLEPALSGNACPDPRKETIFAKLPDACYDFVRSLSRCQIPKIGENKEGERTVDGRTGIPKTCTDFVLPYLNYKSCVSRHAGDPDFFGQEWRIYLGQRWELWADRRETITLSDANGNIIDQLTY